MLQKIVFFFPSVSQFCQQTLFNMLSDVWKGSATNYKLLMFPLSQMPFSLQSNIWSPAASRCSDGPRWSSSVSPTGSEVVHLRPAPTWGTFLFNSFHPIWIYRGELTGLHLHNNEKCSEGSAQRVWRGWGSDETKIAAYDNVKKLRFPASLANLFSIQNVLFPVLV